MLTSAFSVRFSDRNSIPFDNFVIGQPLKDFEGVLFGLPTYRGETPLLASDAAAGKK